MKKISFLTLAAMLFFVTSISAQNSAIQFGVKGGVSLSNFGGSDINKLDDKNALVGFIGGVTLDVPFTESVYLTTGLEYVMKGAKYESTGSVASSSLKFTPSYLQVPVHVAVKIPVASETKVVLGVGPYFAYGVAGKVKGEGSLLGITGSSETDFFGDNSVAKRFDMGAGINAGVEFGKLSISLGYDLGFLNILNKDNNDVQDQFSDNSPSLRNQSGYLTVGFRF